LKAIFGDNWTTTVTNSTTTGETTKKYANTGAIAGGVVGGLALVAIVVFGAFLVGRWRSRRASARQAGLDLQSQPVYPADNYHYH
jgi:hypothetical protein